MSANKPLLYSYWRSSCSWRVRIGLAYKGIEYDTKPVHLIKDGGQQRTAEYASINAAKQVPTLCWQEHNITESISILEFLEEMQPTPSLLPNDIFLKAQVRSVCQLICSGIQPLQNLKVLQYIGDAKKTDWAKHWIYTGFVALEKVLEKTSGKYCIGDVITMADCCLVPQVYNAKRFKIDISEFPIVERVNDSCILLHAFKQAHPTAQVDCPEDERAK